MSGGDPNPTSARARVPIALGVLLCASTALMGWWLGQDMGFDLRNYHFYGPHQLLANRFDVDVDAAGVQSLYSPVLDIPFYLAVKFWHVKPVAIGLVLAAIHGLNLWFVARIGLLLLPFSDSRRRWAAVTTAVVTAAAGAGFVLELGATSGDTTVSVLSLAALAALLTGVSVDGSIRSGAIRTSGMLAGVAAGAKLTAGMTGVGLALALAVAAGSLRDRFARLTRFTLFAGLGFSLVGGYWMWRMYQEFGSPLYPFVDAALRSPYAPVQAAVDALYKPRTLPQWFLYPFFFLSAQTLTHEQPFADGRLAVAYAAVVLFAATALVRWWRGGAVLVGVLEHRLSMLVMFTVGAYLAWLFGSPAYRFAVSLELLAPILALGCLGYCWRRDFHTLAVGIPLCALTVVSTQWTSIGRLPWGDTYFEVNEAALARYESATVLLWDFPSAYLAPFFPPSAAFVRVSSNWPGMRAQAEDRIRKADRERLYAIDLGLAPLVARGATLQPFGLQVDEGRCRWLSSKLERFRVCKLVDAAQPTSDVQAAQGPAALTAFEGYHDAVDCVAISGWAWDRLRPNEPVDVEIFDGSRRLGQIAADQFRADLRAAGKGDGRHAFRVPTPLEVRDGLAHEVSLRFSGTSTNLTRGPYPLTCPP